MGICTATNKSSSNRITANQPPSSSYPTSTASHPPIPNNNEHKSKMCDNKFQDMEEWEGEIYKGYGIKHMKAYKCDLVIDQLNSLREAFWASKKGQENWKYIHQACVYDHIKGEEYLYNHSFKTLNGCINQCVDKDGNIYNIPNYCINDPHFEHKILPNDAKHNDIINIIIIDLFYSRNTEMKLSEGTTGKELTEIYSKKYDIDLIQHNVRFIFGGAFIKDEETLYQHKLKDKYSIQVLINKID